MDGRPGILAAVLAVAPGAAFAQMPYIPLFEGGQRALSLRAGSARPTSNQGFKRAAPPGPALAVRYMRFPIDWAGYGVEAALEKMGASAGFRSLSVLARLNLLRNERWTPYLAGGAGYGLFEAPYFPPAGGAPLDVSSSGLTVVGSAGIEKFVSKRFSLSFEARYQQARLGAASAGGTSVPAFSVETLSFLVGAHLWKSLD